MNTLADIYALLTKYGFNVADQIKDFGGILNGVSYFTKTNNKNQIQYFSIISYEGEFCEAVYELFNVTKRQGKPKGKQKYEELQKIGFAPLETALCRSLEEIKTRIE